MTLGKSAAQAGHAFVQSILSCQQTDPVRERLYHSDGIGTKVCLAAPNLQSLEKAFEEAKSLGIPTSLITDSGHTSFHGGQPIVTALGIGPATRAEVHHITKHYKLLE